jgi:hypothetical protein
MLRRVARVRTDDLLVTTNVPSWPILVILMMEAIHSFETSALIRPTLRNTPEDGILHYE